LDAFAPIAANADCKVRGRFIRPSNENMRVTEARM
jgi:hypothetical protein